MGREQTCVSDLVRGDERLFSRFRFNEHVIVRRCKAASIRTRRRDVVDDKDDDLRAIADHSAKSVGKFASRAAVPEPRTADPPIAEKAAAITADDATASGSRRG